MIDLAQGGAICRADSVGADLPARCGIDCAVVIGFEEVKLPLPGSASQPFKRSGAVRSIAAVTQTRAGVASIVPTGTIHLVV